MAGFACTSQQIIELRDILGTADAVKNVCASFNVSSLGSERAALRYLARRDNSEFAELVFGLNTSFVLFSGYLVFVMQAGFAMLCAGHIRAKNNGNILLKNLLDCAVGTVAWFLVGHAFAFGTTNGTANAFIGAGQFALSTVTDSTRGDGSYSVFLFHWAFSAAAATITAGAVAERMSFGVYFGYTVLMTSFVYPVVAHWLWTEWGWLSALNASPLFGSGAIDFAGGGVVHLLGGTAALMGALFSGPRVGRFSADGEVNKDFRNTSSTLVVLGTFLLWFGWYGFNPGSVLAISGQASASAVARTAVTTTLAAGSGGVAALSITYAISRYWNVMELCNGVLAGAVSITASCGIVQPWVALIVGVLGAATFIGMDRLLLKLQIDDVVAAVPLHCGCGALGLLMTGFFADGQYVAQFYGAVDGGARRWGVFWGGDGRLLACQIVALLVIISWTTLFMAPYFWTMRQLQLIRVPIEQELAGLDASKYAIITTNELPQMPRPRNHMPA